MLIEIVCVEMCLPPLMNVLLAAHWGRTVLPWVPHHILRDTKHLVLTITSCYRNLPADWLPVTPLQLWAQAIRCSLGRLQNGSEKKRKGVIRLFAASFVPICLTWHCEEMTFKMLCWQAADYEIRAQQTVRRSDCCTTTTHNSWKCLLCFHRPSSPIRNILDFTVWC